MVSEPIRYRAKRIDSDRFGMDMWVTGHYFTTPLTDENSGAPAEAGWFFLSGADQPTRYLIVDCGTAFTVDPDTLEPVADDIRAAGYVPVAERDALAAQVERMRIALLSASDWIEDSRSGIVTVGDPAQDLLFDLLQHTLAISATAAEERVRALEEAAWVLGRMIVAQDRPMTVSASEWEQIKAEARKALRALDNATKDGGGGE